MILLFILALIAIIFLKYQKKNITARPNFYPSGEFVLIGHRGAPKICKENTIESFMKAFELGLQGIEVDVQISNDRKIVIFHDWDLINMSGIRKNINKMDYSEIKTSSPENAPIPLLSDLLKIIPNDRFINIEIKSKKINNLIFVNEILKLIKTYNKEKSVIISSFNPFLLKSLNKISPYIPTAFLWCRKDPLLVFNSPLWIWICHPNALHININDVDERIMKWARNKMLTVLAFTVNNIPDLNKAKKLGLDGVFTDDPYIMR